MSISSAIAVPIASRIITPIVFVPAVPPFNHYVNPLMEGGAASGPGPGSNPPTAHDIGFNTLNSGPILDGWEINPEGASGRSYLVYDVDGNNPLLVIGQEYRLQINMTLISGSETNMISANAVADVDLGTNDVRVPPGQTKNLFWNFTPTAPGWTLDFRIGTGATTNRTEHITLNGPSKILGPE